MNVLTEAATLGLIYRASISKIVSLKEGDPSYFLISVHEGSPIPISMNKALNTSMMALAGVA